MSEENRTTKEIQNDIGAMIMGEPISGHHEASETDPESSETQGAEALAASEHPEHPEQTEDHIEDHAEGDQTQDQENNQTEVAFRDVEINGKVYEIPEEIAENFIYQSDYTKKTQAVATERKEIENQRSLIEQQARDYQFAADAQNDLLEISQFDQTISQWEAYLSQEARNMDAQSLTQAQLQIKQLERERQSKYDALVQKKDAFQQEREQTLKGLAEKGTEVLRGKIPNWGEQHQAQVVQYGLSQGFTESELGALVDPRQVEVLWKASQYDQLQQGKVAAKEKVTSLPSIKPKARNPMPKDTREKLDYRNKIKSKKLSAKQKAKEMEAHFGAKFAK